MKSSAILILPNSNCSEYFAGFPSLNCISISICRIQCNCSVFMHGMGETQQLLQQRPVNYLIMIFYVKMNLNMAKTEFGEQKNVFISEYAHLTFVTFLIHSENNMSNLCVTHVL